MTTLPDVVVLGEDSIAIEISSDQALVLAKILTDYRSRVVPMSRAQLVAAGVRADLVDQVASVDGYDANLWTEVALALFEARGETQEVSVARRPDLRVVPESSGTPALDALVALNMGLEHEPPSEPPC